MFELLCQNALYILLVLVITKSLLFFVFKSSYWKLPHFILFSATNIKSTLTKDRAFIKVLQNILSVIILSIGIVYSTLSLLFSNSSTYHYVELKENAAEEKVIPLQVLHTMQPVDVESTITPAQIVTEVKRSIEPIKKEPAQKKVIQEVSKKKNLSKGEMYSILYLINIKKKEQGAASNAIQIVKTKDSNITNAFDLAKFLQSKGFIIAGRETKNIVTDYYEIDISDIIKITIGRF